MRIKLWKTKTASETQSHRLKREWPILKISSTNQAFSTCRKTILILAVNKSKISKWIKSFRTNNKIQREKKKRKCQIQSLTHPSKNHSRSKKKKRHLEAKVKTMTWERRRAVGRMHPSRESIHQEICILQTRICTWFQVKRETRMNKSLRTDGAQGLPSNRGLMRHQSQKSMSLNSTGSIIQGSLKSISKRCRSRSRWLRRKFLF